MIGRNNFPVGPTIQCQSPLGRADDPSIRMGRLASRARFGAADETRLSNRTSAHPNLTSFRNPVYLNAIGSCALVLAP